MTLYTIVVAARSEPHEGNKRRLYEHMSHGASTYSCQACASTSSYTVRIHAHVHARTSTCTSVFLFANNRRQQRTPSPEHFNIQSIISLRQKLRPRTLVQALGPILANKSRPYSIPCVRLISAAAGPGRDSAECRHRAATKQYAALFSKNSGK